MKVSRLALLGLILFIAAAVGASAATRTLPLTAEDNHITLLSQQGDVLHFSVEVGELTAMDIATKRGEFTRLMIAGFHFSHDEGSPELPMMNRLIEIPYGGTARIEMVADESRMIDLADYGIEHPLFPAQPSMPKSADPETWPFVLDQGSYEADQISPELVAIAPVGRLRSVDLGRLEISPVEYFPNENRIRVHERVEFRVVFDGVDHAAELDYKARTHSPFFTGLYQQIDGYRTPHTDHPDLMADVVTMVVITPASYAPYMQEYVDWKTQRGFHTIMGVMGTSEVGSTTTSIKAYIADLYNDPPAGMTAPSFVLFVGDVEQVPTFTEGGDATDRPYCCIDADIIPDIYYGRFSAATTTQLQAILDKTLMYDQFTMPNPAYLGEVVMIAGMDSGHGTVWANGQINYGTTTYFNLAHGITSHTHLYPQSGSEAAQIVQEVSNGCAYVNYTAHGSTTSWSDPSFTQSQVSGLANNGEYCLAVANCCLTSSYDISECFAETWLRVPNKGAIGYIGGSNSTYWDEDYWWGVGYRSSVVTNPVYDANALGAYDGIFHDHGEAMTQWYVTNDAIVFAGNLAVTQAGSSLTTYYWNIYNLMGDPSLTTYLGVPSANPVVHPPTIFTTWSSIEIEAAPNSYVGLTQNGEIIGAGTVGPTGVLDLPLANPLLPGPAQLVVMGQNHEPYVAEVNIMIPATVFIDPVEIDANVTTPISVGVFEYDGVTPKPGIEVWADGLNYESAHSFTDVDGYCTISVTYPFGPTLDIVGKDPVEPWELFREAIIVHALPLTLPNLHVTTTVGLVDTFALNLQGTLHADVIEIGCRLWAVLNDEVVGSSLGKYYTFTPDETGFVTGIISKSGYNIYTEYFPVIEAYGTLTGHVDAGGAPAVGAIVRGYDGDMDLVFEKTTNGSGNYDVGEEIVVQNYTITCDYFGYLHYEQSYFLNYGANVCDIDMTAAPAGVMSGVVTETGTGLPLTATIKVYRTDTGELYVQTTSDPLDGSYTTPSLPYFDYNVNVKAWHHIPANIALAVDEAVEVRDFVLEATIGDLLVIDDSAKEKSYPAKLHEKTGEVLAPAGEYGAGKAAADIVADLEDVGYTVTLETMGATNPATWESYDLIVVSSGNNTATLANATFRAALTSFVQSGGHLLVEGGEVGYNWYSADASFATNVLRISDWNHDDSGNVTVSNATHHVMSVPNTIPTPITMTYAGYGDEDANVPAAGAQMIGAWTDYPSDASVIVYDSNPAPEGGQFVFFCFNYSAMDAAVRLQLLENAVIWLMTPEIGNCSVTGHARLYGESDHSGIRVEGVPGGGYCYTDQFGNYTLPGLYAGTYTIRATKDGWAAGGEEVTLSDGQQMTGVDLWLTAVQEEELCVQANLAITDYTEITSTMPVELEDATVDGIEVYVNITHTYIGDLQVWLVAPSAASVMLHDRSGGTTDNLIGWYPSPLTPDESLDGFVDVGTDGNWVLHVKDAAGGDSGMLNQWCMRITYGGGIDPASVEEKLPTVLALRANRPNPVRGYTAIAFDLPQAGPVELAVYDVTGRQVKSLISGELKAGNYQTVWQGTDESGNGVSSAVYFYRLRANGQTITKKMMVID